MRTISFQNFNNFLPQSSFEEKVQLFCSKWFSNATHFTFFTSGSTGIPKEIILSRKQLENSALQTINWLDLKPNQNALLCLPPDYIAGAMVLVRAMMAKMNLLLIEPSQDISKELGAIRVPIHLSSFVPNQWQLLLSASLSLNELFKESRGVLIGGSDVSLQIKKKTNQLCDFKVFLTYGMTETVSHVAFQSIGKEPTDYLKVLPSVSISQLAMGNLAISAPSTLFETVETQDLVEMIDQQSFRVVGRLNRMINSAGLKINPKEIEDKLVELFQKHHLVNDFFVAGFPDEFFGEVVSIFVEGKFFLSLNDINNYLIQFIEKNKLPKKLIAVDQFSRTSSQKIDYLKTIQQVQ